MSAIDQYFFTCIAIIDLPLTYLPLAEDEDFDWMYVAVYRLEQDIPEDEDEFQGKTGDILVGGGSGEAAAMRILMPEAIVETTDFDRFYDDEEYSNRLDGVTYPGLYDIYQFFWDPEDGYKLGSGYVTLGWDPDGLNLGLWLTQHIVSFVLKHYPQDYAHLKGDDELDYL